MPLNALYVDFNSYFASVEQELRPKLRGRPIGVVPVQAETTCCIAASIEAKTCGVKTGTLVRDARKLCPDIVFVEARPQVYIDMHHRLVAAVESCTHVERTLSIDEMVCRLRGSEQQADQALALAGRIKRAVAQRVGRSILCSIGIAPNTFLAKLASDMQKPDGCVVIQSHELPERLYGLELRALCGIGRKMEQRLLGQGIREVRDLLQLNREQLRLAWGSVEGERMYDRLRGVDLPERPSQRSSIGHSHVLPPDLRNPQAAYAVLHRLLQKAAMRLRSYGLLAGNLRLKVKFLNAPDWENSGEFVAGSDTLQFVHVLDQLWRDFPQRKAAVPCAVAITLGALEEPTRHTPSLFEADRQPDKLNAIVDTLNLRYGKNTVYFGGAHAALHAAPMRIAFTYIPDARVESDQ